MVLAPARHPNVFLVVLGAAVLLACQPATPPAPPVPEALRRDLELTEPQARYLQTLADAADTHPADPAAQKASGMAHMRFTLSGVLSLQSRAEQDLEAAFALDPNDPELTRSLGRFYNMRAVAGDDTKAERQVEVYRALLGDRLPEALTSREFVAWSFAGLGKVLSEKNQGRMLAALDTVGDLEDALKQRTQASPEDIELQALAGNFAFFFAGNVPFGRKERVEAAVAYFEQVRRRWSELRPGAHDPEHCPNTYENFMFELAEGHTVLGNRDAARGLYEELETIREPVTRAKEQIAYVARERLRNLAAYEGEYELMPPWPSDVGNCVVCHAYSSDVPLTSLHSVEPIELDDIPTQAMAKPVLLELVLPDAVRELVEQRCVPCHRPGGQAAAEGDFSNDEGIQAHARAIVRRVTAGEMPPTGALPSDEAAILEHWLEGATASSPTSSPSPPNDRSRKRG